ncbi:MAG TPA: hypothetical protein VFU06_02730 [Longimicrobiales bacterium]|nr:hypothetical protein [Longimicrobiales bacterium]
MSRRSVLFSGLALVLTSVSAQAQTTATAAVSIQINPVLAISSSGAFTFPVADDSHYDAGEIVSTGGPSLTHRANVPYQITLEAQSGTSFTFAPAAGRSDADPNKPVSDLRIQADFGGAPADEVVGSAGSGTTFFTRATRGGNLTGELTARMALDYDDDPPGTYSTTVVFTMVAQ